MQNKTMCVVYVSHVIRTCHPYTLIARRCRCSMSPLVVRAVWSRLSTVHNSTQCGFHVFGSVCMYSQLINPTVAPFVFRMRYQRPTIIEQTTTTTTTTAMTDGCAARSCDHLSASRWLHGADTDTDLTMECADARLEVEGLGGCRWYFLISICVVDNSFKFTAREHPQTGMIWTHKINIDDKTARSDYVR